jgi:hypothetical protein
VELKFIAAAVAALLIVANCDHVDKEQNKPPLPFPIRLGDDLQNIRSQILARFGSDEALDTEDVGAGSAGAYRSRAYNLIIPGTAGVDVTYRYRASDHRIWSIVVANAGGHFSGAVGKVPLNGTIDQVLSALGRPLTHRQRAPVIDTYWWETPQFGYRADIYNKRYDDIAESYREGGIERVQIWARDLAPPGYDAYRTSRFF